MEIRIITCTELITRSELAAIAKRQFGEFVKAAVDIKKEVMAIGGELHADEEAVLLEQGSQQEDVWGINLYPARSQDEWIEFNSMINVRPSQGNRSRGVENEETRNRIRDVVGKIVSATSPA